MLRTDIGMNKRCAHENASMYCTSTLKGVEKFSKEGIRSGAIVARSIFFLPTFSSTLSCPGMPPFLLLCSPCPPPPTLLALPGGISSSGNCAIRRQWCSGQWHCMTGPGTSAWILVLPAHLIIVVLTCCHVVCMWCCFHCF